MGSPEPDVLPVENRTLVDLRDCLEFNFEFKTYERSQLSLPFKRLS